MRLTEADTDHREVLYFIYIYIHIWQQTDVFIIKFVKHCDRLKYNEVLMLFLFPLNASNERFSDVRALVNRYDVYVPKLLQTPA